jgi:hypothetical protein
MGNGMADAWRDIRRRFLRSAALLGAGLGLTQPNIVAAQQAPTSVATAVPEGQAVAFPWGGLTWHIPKRFPVWPFPPNEDRWGEFLITFGLAPQGDGFSPASLVKGHLSVNVHIRRVDDENPGNALALIHRIGLPFTKIPLFVAGKFNGMTYLGSSSGNHYFLLKDPAVHVECSLVTSDRLRPPAVAPDVLSKPFYCQTMFALPGGNYAWARIWYVQIGEAAPAFRATYRELRSFIL